MKTKPRFFFQNFSSTLKARLHRRSFCRGNLMQYLSQQNCIKFQTCLKPLRYRGDKSHWKSQAGLHVGFWSCNFGATKIASSCRDKNRPCKRAFTVLTDNHSLYKQDKTWTQGFKGHSTTVSRPQTNSKMLPVWVGSAGYGANEFVAKLRKMPTVQVKFLIDSYTFLLPFSREL